MSLESTSSKNVKPDLVDSANKYLRLLYLISGLLIFLSGLIIFFISSKVAPLELKIAIAENKLKDHIVDTSKCLEKVINKEVFEMVIQTIQNDIKLLKESQESFSKKQIELDKKLDKNHDFIAGKLDLIADKLP